LIEFVARHQVLSLIAAFVLGLNAPAGVRRVARWIVLFLFWVGFLIWLVPVGAVALGLYLVGISVVPRDDDLPPLSTQMWLPFDR
jgi:hypothetical protein